MQAAEQMPSSPAGRDGIKDGCALLNGIGHAATTPPTSGFHTFTMTGDAIIWTGAAATPARSPAAGPRRPNAAVTPSSPGSILDAFTFNESFDGDPGQAAVVSNSFVGGAAGGGVVPAAAASAAEANSTAAAAAAAAASAAADSSSSTSGTAGVFAASAPQVDRHSDKAFLHGFIRLDARDGILTDVTADSRSATSPDPAAADAFEEPSVQSSDVDGRHSSAELDAGDILGLIRKSGGDAGVVVAPASRANSVDVAAAQRLAKRLYQLDGFKRRDVMKHLGKNNDFSRVVSEEYFKFFDLGNLSLVAAMRVFLKLHTLQGETYERERVLSQLSHRYVSCNPHILPPSRPLRSPPDADGLAPMSSPAGADGFRDAVLFQSEDACHTLTCAIMLLNTDLHGQNIGKKMTQQEFIDNLEGLNDGKDYPKDLLKAVYQDIRDEPLSWPSEEADDGSAALSQEPSKAGALEAGTPPASPSLTTGNCFIAPPNPNEMVEYKRGPLKRKCCTGPGGVKVPKGKRGWKAFVTVLRGAALYFAKDDAAAASSLASAPYVRIHHALATPATDYKKSKFAMRLQTADQSAYLFQTSDKDSLEDWITTINLVAATTSAPELPAPVGSQSKFRRPLLPSSLTTLNLRDQLSAHESKLEQVLRSASEHAGSRPPAKGSTRAELETFAEKEQFLQFEAERYKVYADLLRGKLREFPELEPNLVNTPIGECDEPPPSPARLQQLEPQQQQQYEADAATAFSATISWKKGESRTATDRGGSEDPAVGEANGMYMNIETIDTFL